MTNFWKITAAIAILIIGILLGKALWGCGESPDVAKIQKEAQAKIKSQEEKIRIYENKLADLQIYKFQLSDSIEILNREYAEFRSNPISSKKTDSLTTELNRKGREAFGNAGNNNKTSTALVFGNQFADNNGILKKQLDNQKAQITAQQGIIIHKDTIIQIQQITINDISKTTKRQKNRARVQGFLAGGGVVALLFLLL